MTAIIIQCHRCGKDVEKKQSRIDYASKNNRRMFCDQSCSLKYYAKQRRDNFIMPIEKSCTICNEIKLLYEFHLSPASLDNRASHCKECSKAKTLEWGRNNKEKRNEYHKKARYGMTLKDEAEMCESQDGRCAICRKPRILVIDHCHTTGVIRGMLCLTCNLALGGFKDSPHNLRKAADYLEKTPVYKISKEK